MAWQEDVEDLVSDCVEEFGEPEVYTISRKVRGAFNTASGTREADDYSQSITLIEYRRDQSLVGQYGVDVVVYRGKWADITDSMGPEPRLAEGMYVTDSDGVARRIVKVNNEAARQAFALVCVTDR